MRSGASEILDLLLSHPAITLACYINIMLITTFFQTLTTSSSTDTGTNDV